MTKDWKFGLAVHTKNPTQSHGKLDYGRIIALVDDWNEARESNGQPVINCKITMQFSVNVMYGADASYEDPEIKVVFLPAEQQLEGLHHEEALKDLLAFLGHHLTFEQDPHIGIV